MSTTAAISTVVLRAWFDALELSDRERAGLLEQLSLAESLLDHYDVFVDEALLGKLVRWAIARDGPDVGLRASRSLPRGALAVVEYLMRTADDLSHAMEYLLRYQRLLGSRQMFRATRLGAFHFELVPAADPSDEVAAAIAEFWLGSVVRLARPATTRSWHPELVRFAHAAPSTVAPYRRTFGCPVEFEAARAEILVPADVLALPMRETDPRLRAILQRCVAEVVEPLAERASDAVRRLVATALPTGAPDLAAAAEQLELSGRVLQNRLRDEGMTYREVVEDVRRTLAERYLRDEHLSIPEIALLLGYSEASAFHRAFKRWTDTTPGQFRRTAKVA